MKILLLILAGISILMLVACSQDESYIIMGCGEVESEYIKDQVNPENHIHERDQNEIMKTSDPGIH
jgi:hypothetical protein